MTDEFADGDGRIGPGECAFATGQSLRVGWFRFFFDDEALPARAEYDPLLLTAHLRISS